MTSSSAGNQPEQTSMDAARKVKVLTEIPMKFRTGEKIDPADWKDFVRAQNDELKTGPEVGTKAPYFTLPDENGKSWALKDLMGPGGLLLVFTRSADW